MPITLENPEYPSGMSHVSPTEPVPLRWQWHDMSRRITDPSVKHPHSSLAKSHAGADAHDPLGDHGGGGGAWSSSRLPPPRSGMWAGPPRAVGETGELSPPAPAEAEAKGAAQLPAP
eukprot:CAMPEP_0183815024 /NCGR_PEP_ID=MMETSP0803_2-20130417/56098_1 /TAXON_ID=195967 /ORGANISM="Crustomastix stigmata, Strain CCMP3273" /LENGTH=116 /DNA_ID=CAMNT_0026059889 /DNA_START=36 /DNA_END=382 /DNA_ORIENTATION=+